MEFDAMEEFLSELNSSETEFTEADEAAVFLTALESECSPEEFNLVLENLHELEIYGLIPSAEVAMEAKKIAYKVTKQMNMNRETAKACLRSAERKDTPAWKKYHKYRTLMLEARAAIYKQEAATGKKMAKNVLSNAKKKASSMKGNTVTGEMIYNKIGAKQQKLNAGAKK